MIVFIDESGDSGFALEKGSSPIFVIVCIIFNDELEAEKTAVAIKELRRKLKFSDRVEFKFNGSKYKIRTAFLTAIKHYSFKIRVLVARKEKIRSNQLKTNKRSFYSFFIKMILKYNRDRIKNAKIRIDGSGDRIFRRKFLTYLRKELNSQDRKIVNNIKLVDSKDNVLIQMADMIAGTARRYKEGVKKDAADYWNIIKYKIDDCWEFK